MTLLHAKRPGLTDRNTLRAEARRSVSDGAVTVAYGADREAVIAMLQNALATELTCALRYRQHHFVAKSPVSPAIKNEFLEHANEEQQHADQIAERIVQLGGAPDFNPASFAARSDAEYVSGTELRQMLIENLVAERIAVQAYTEMIHAIGESDPTTRRLLESILAKEEEHADELSDLLPRE
ncbi:ferritin-like domain-containing protein [Derxia gummosa]|uniref:Ferritin-like domain-containing protein n=1 Tax=Derxia gummosa DSM 723 TaxID=1121388 RepID=A0A8B6X4Y7_9BURK|nr:ferritin-like domain-containing protein [Derxia gummosa]